MGSGFARGIAALGIGMQGLATGLRQGEEWKAERDRRQREDQWRAERDALTKQYQADLRAADEPDVPPSPSAAPPSAPVAQTSEPADIKRYGMNPDAPTQPAAPPASPAAALAEGETAPTANEQPAAPKMTPRLAQMRLYEGLAAIDLKHGKVDPAGFAGMTERAKQLREEGAFDAYQYYGTTGDLKGAIERFDAFGSKRINKDSVEARKVVNPATGIEYDELRGQYQDGTPFVFNPLKMAYGLVGPQAWVASQERAAERKARADRDEADRKERRDKADAEDRNRKAGLEIQAGHLSLAQQEAADRRLRQKREDDARKEYSDAVKSGDPQRINNAASVIRAFGVNVPTQAQGQKPDKYSTHTTPFGGVAITNDSDGSARIFDANGKPVAEVQSPKRPSAPTGQAAIPALADRKVGQVYDTPRGKMIWRGNGWEAAK